MGTYLTQIINYLLTQSWQIAILAAVIAAVTLALKNKSAHIRYLLWLIVLAKCLVPPLLTIPLAILPESKAGIVLPPAEPMAIETVRTSVAETPARLVPAVIKHTPRLTVHQWLAVAWIMGVSIFVLPAVVKALRTELWLRRARKPIPAGLQTETNDLFSSLGVRVPPKLWLVEGIGQPFVWGWLRGAIYLPAGFVKANNAEHRRGILCHELSHILRFDAAVNLLQVVAQSIFWFHPFVWWANKRIRAEREKCCDEMTIARLGAKAKDYSKAIVNILISEQESTRPVPSLAIAGPVKNIEERIKTMLRPGKKFYKRPSLVTATVVLLFSVFTVPTALVLTSRAETETPRPETRLTWPVHEAAAAGDIEKLRSLISQGADVNTRDPNDATPLHEAAWQGDKDIVKLLIEKGANVNAIQGRSSWTPLHCAADQGHKDVAEILIASGADVNVCREGGTPLHTAASQGQLEMATFLIDKGADVNAKDSSGGTPLLGAAQNDHVSLAKLLIEKGANLDARDENGRTALHRAAPFIRSRATMELLVAEGADVNSKDNNGETPADSAFDSTAPYSNATVKFLVGKGAAISKIEGIYLAAYLGDLAGVKDYLRQGKDVNVANKDGSTSLHISAMAGEREMIEFLIANGADLNMKDHSGSTALDYAQCQQHFNIAKFLVAKGAISTVPKGWYRRGSHPKDYAMTIDRSNSHGGQACAHIRFTGDKALGFGTLLQSFRADDYRGKRVTMSAWMKTKEAQSAQLWMRLDGIREQLGLDNMDDRPVKGTKEWSKYEITLDVPQKTVGVYFGAFVKGTGQAWVDDFNFSVVGDYIPATNKLTQEEIDAEREEIERKAQAYPQQPANLDFEDPGQ